MMKKTTEMKIRNTIKKAIDKWSCEYIDGFDEAFMEIYGINSMYDLYSDIEIDGRVYTYKELHYCQLSDVLYKTALIEINKLKLNSIPIEVVFDAIGEELDELSKYIDIRLD